MGRMNAEEIRACEKARKTNGEDSVEYRRAAEIVDATQAKCPHKRKSKYVMPKMKRPSKYRAGAKMVFCLDCSKPLIWET